MRRYTIKKNTIDPITRPTSFLKAGVGSVIDRGTLVGVAGYKKFPWFMATGLKKI